MIHNLSPTFFTLPYHVSTYVITVFERQDFLSLPTLEQESPTVFKSLLTSLQFLSVKRDFVFWAWFRLLSMISSFERDFVFWAWFRLLSVISSFEREFVIYASNLRIHANNVPRANNNCSTLVQPLTTDTLSTVNLQVIGKVSSRVRSYLLR